MAIIAYKCKRDCNCSSSFLCGDLCTSTLHIEHAERDENGEPIEAWRIPDMLDERVYGAHREEE